MTIWAIADLHLSFGVPEKKMDVFGPKWEGHADRIRTHWLNSVAKEDLVLIPGDISWAMKLNEARVDLEWLDALPGTKVMIKGNHDYWWSSISKVKEVLPPSLHAIQNNAFQWENVSIAGTRLWDSDEYNFDSFIEFRKSLVPPKKEEKRDQQKLFNRELERLELSLKSLDQKAPIRIAMTHYPPIGSDLKPSKTDELLKKYRVQICVFGHLHNVKEGVKLFGLKGGIHYYLTSCDFLDFQPLKLF